MSIAKIRLVISPSPTKAKAEVIIIIIHMIDNLDAEMMMMTSALALVGEGEMTNRIFAMDNRSFYKPNFDK